MSGVVDNSSSYAINEVDVHKSYREGGRERGRERGKRDQGKTLL